MYWTSHLLDEPNVPPAELSAIIPDANDHGFRCSSGFEQLLQDNHVFINGIKGTPCHSDSYMTCVDYARLKIVLDALEAQFAIAPTVIKGLIDTLEGINQQIPMRLVAADLRNRYGGCNAR